MDTPDLPPEALGQWAAMADGFQRLWTPHRMVYIQGEGKPSGADECPFCTSPRREDADGLIVYRGEIAFGLHPTARGQSLMSRAGRLALDWAFDVAGFPAVEWNAMVGNWASRQVAAALGFRFEGVRRAYLPYREWLKDCWTATALATGPRCSVTPAPQPVVRHAGMVLRPFRAGDLQQVVSACADPLSQRWLGHLPAEFGPAQARDFLADCWEGAAQFDHWTWCITTAGDDRCAGAITLFGLREQAATGEIGYWLHPQARGRGLAKTAARTVVDLALGEFLGHVPALTHTALMHSLVIRVPVDNRASHAVARATGARIVGRLPQAELLRSGDWTDLVVYSRVRGRAGQPAPHAR